MNTKFRLLLTLVLLTAVPASMALAQGRRASSSGRPAGRSASQFRGGFQARPNVYRSGASFARPTYARPNYNWAAARRPTTFSQSNGWNRTVYNPARTNFTTNRTFVNRRGTNFAGNRTFVNTTGTNFAGNRIAVNRSATGSNWNRFNSSSNRLAGNWNGNRFGTNGFNHGANGFNHGGNGFNHGGNWWHNHHHGHHHDDSFVFIGGFGFPFFSAWDYGYYPTAYYPYYPYGAYAYDPYGYSYGTPGYNYGPYDDSGYYGDGYSDGYSHEDPGYDQSSDDRRYDPNGAQSDSVVTQVQEKLVREGYYKGSIDGVLGSRTYYAIRAYERDHNLPVNGAITDRLLQEMGLRYAGGD